MGEVSTRYRVDYCKSSAHLWPYLLPMKRWLHKAEKRNFRFFGRSGSRN